MLLNFHGFFVYLTSWNENQKKHHASDRVVFDQSGSFHFPLGRFLGYLF